VRRREFFTLLGGAATWPLAVTAQQPAMPVIGFLSIRSSRELAQIGVPFQRGLREMGYVEGRNVIIEYRWAGGEYARLPGLVADLVRRQVNVIAALAGLPGARAAKAATASVPIVFQTGVDPVEAGLVASLPRLGGNITGVTTLGNEVGPKRLELLHELLPAVAEVALLINPSNPNAETSLRDLRAAANALGVNLRVLSANADHELEMAFTGLSKAPGAALVISNDPFFVTRSEELGALAMRYAVPAVFYTREFAAAGGVMGYGGSLSDSYRFVGIYAGRILKGEKPADLPVQQATKVELIINLKAARKLGVTVPLPLLARADEVIE
jgi:putative ABC transport system substrate-binding protein